MLWKIKQTNKNRDTLHNERICSFESKTVSHCKLRQADTPLPKPVIITKHLAVSMHQSSVLFIAPGVSFLTATTHDTCWKDFTISVTRALYPYNMDRAEADHKMVKICLYKGFVEKVQVSQ